MAFDFTSFNVLFQSIQIWFLNLWWFWLFIGFLLLFLEVWKGYIQESYVLKILSPVLLELRVPREVLRSPRAMEQVFLTIHALRNYPGNLHEKWWDGEVTLWFSCEIVSIGGELHFYLRVPEKHRNIIESVLYAHYPDIEIKEAEDYVIRMPTTAEKLLRMGYKFFGSELVLSKPDAYPIKSYIDFEEKVEEKELDPISALLEVMTKIKSEEQIWIQIIIRPVTDSWKKSGELLIQELKEKTAKTRIESKTGVVMFTERTPGELETMKAIERNIAKPGFDVVIRYLYLSPEGIFSGTNFAQRGIASAFNQYASEALNKFKHNYFAWTRASYWYWPYIFPQGRLRAKRERMYQNYRNRYMPAESFVPRLPSWSGFHPIDVGIGAQKMGMVLNTEELATLFHLPTSAVLTGPLVKRSEGKKIGPPAGLPIYGEGEELEGMEKQ